MHFAPVVFSFNIIRLAENSFKKRKRKFVRAFGLFKHEGIASGIVLLCEHYLAYSFLFFSCWCLCSCPINVDFLRFLRLTIYFVTEFCANYIYIR